MPSKSMEEKIKLAIDTESELRNERAETLKNGIKYMFVTNSGGAVSFLGFLGTSSDMRSIESNYYALFCFVLGLLLIGLYLSLQFQCLEYLHGKYVSTLNSYYKKNINIDLVLQRGVENQNKVANGWSQKLSYFFAYGSFLCFIIGCLIAFTTYL